MVADLTGRVARLILAAAAVITGVAGLPAVAAPPAAAADPVTAVIADPACSENVLPANDDGSTSLVPLSFTGAFGDIVSDSVYVNNNGNVTFERPLRAYTPEELSVAGEAIIAPFWADVDTRVSGSEPVRYGWGQTVFEGRPAMCVNWLNVGYYGSSDSKQNSFQLLLVDRSDVMPGAFDAVFNYGTVEWETGTASGGSGGLGGSSARVGFATGGTTQWFEAAGSALPGTLLDTGELALVNRSMNSDVRGRFVLPFRNGHVDDHLLSEGIGNPSRAPAPATVHTAEFELR